MLQIIICSFCTTKECPYVWTSTLHFRLYSGLAAATVDERVVLINSIHKQYDLTLRADAFVAKHERVSARDEDS